MAFRCEGNVVVPLDFSKESARAVHTALQIVVRPAEVHLVHVLFPLKKRPVFRKEVDNQKQTDAAREQIEEFLTRIEVSGVNVAVEFGDPGLQIADYAARIGAELIVIASRGSHGVKRLLLGSVAERVLRHAPCSVLVVRGTIGE